MPGGSEIEETAAWAREHLPPPEPSVLVHGDLLGQNILLRPDEPTGVIDWEYSTLGDPAYDLAVVTRGVRRPFQIAGGLERLLDVYASAGGANVSAAQVRVHELSLAANWYREALAGRAEPPGEALARFRAILRRALASSIGLAFQNDGVTVAEELDPGEAPPCCWTSVARVEKPSATAPRCRAPRERTIPSSPSRYLQRSRYGGAFGTGCADGALDA